MLTLLTVPSRGGIIFNFESQPSGGFPTIVDTQSGITLTATSTETAGYVRTDNPPHSLPAGMGQRALVGSETQDLMSNQFTPVRMEFLPSLLSLSLLTGDAGGDDDGTVRIRAFNSSNVLVDADTFVIGDETSSVTLSVAAAEIKYIIADSFGGPDNFNSVLWDNVEVVAVPEPSALILLAFGAIPLLRYAQHHG